MSNREKLATVSCQLFQEYGGHEKFDCSLIVAQACDEQINHILQPSTLECSTLLVWCTNFDMGTALLFALTKSEDFFFKLPLLLL